VAAFALAHEVGTSPRRSEPSFHAHLTVLPLDGGVFHRDVRKTPLLFAARYESDQCCLLVAPRQLVGYEVANGRPGAFQLRVARQMNNKHVEFVFLRRRVGAQTFVTSNVSCEGGFDGTGFPPLRLGFVDVVEQINREGAKASLVELIREHFLNKRPGLFGVHRCLTSSEERTT